jgi:indole-3-glycerol phosphate synthase
MILNQILERKKVEISQLKDRYPLADLRSRSAERQVPSFSDAIQQQGINIIAEIKYKSPSHGPFLCQEPPGELAKRYREQGAAAISVLTDESFFGGSLEHLRQVSECLNSPELDQIPGQSRVPLLRKDFIIDRYQIVEAAAAGASAFLLIVACLERQALKQFWQYGREHGLDPLVEVHNSYELEAAVETGARIVGVNNRDLRTFEVNVETSFEIARRMEGETDFILVAESGISNPSLISELRDAGFSAFLIGTALMDAPDPARRLRELLGTE